MNMDFNIENFLSIENYNTEVRKLRRGEGHLHGKIKKSTQEFFTPYSIVKHMCDKIPDEDWSDPSKTFLEPCMGSGNFILMIIYNRIIHGIDWKTALETLFGLELMQDNVDECKDRVIELLKQMNIEFNEDMARDIMDHNFVCHDFFTWNFEEWREYTPEEIKRLKIKTKKDTKSINYKAENLAA